MSVQPVILVFGRDPNLLSTRRLVLQQAGFQVVTAETLAHAESTLAVRSIDLFLLCHTISMDDCQRLLAAANRIWPQMKLIVMAANKPICYLSRDQPVISAFDGPRALINAVHQLLFSQSRNESVQYSTASTPGSCKTLRPYRRGSSRLH